MTVTEGTRSSTLHPIDVGDDLELVALALQQAPCGAVVASTDAAGEILYVNDEFTRITGYTLVDVPTVGDWLLKAYPDPAYRAEVMANWERDVSEPRRDVFYRVTVRGGAEREMLLRAGLLPHERMVVTLLDVTDLRRVERQLQVNEAQLRLISETVDHVLWTAQREPP